MFKSLPKSTGDFVHIYGQSYLCDRLRRAAANTFKLFIHALFIYI
jgi:hypothetical protein